MPPPSSNQLPSLDFFSGPGTTPNGARSGLTGLGTSDLINWANMGVQTGNQLDFKPATRHPPFVSHKSDNGKLVLVTHPLDLTYFVGGAQGGWKGRFKNGDGVLFTNDVPPDVVDETWKESIIIHLPAGVRGGGVQFDIKPPVRPPGEPPASVNFTAHIVCRQDDWVHFLETKASGSIAPGQAAGSAVFLGTASALPGLKFITIELWVTSGNGQQLDFAINQVSLVT